MHRESVLWCPPHTSLSATQFPTHIKRHLFDSNATKAVGTAIVMAMAVVMVMAMVMAMVINVIAIAVCFHIDMWTITAFVK